MTFEEYLQKLEDSEVCRDFVAPVRELLGFIHAQFPTLPLPAAGPNTDDTFSLIWASKQRHVDVILMLQDDTFLVEWFWRDRVKNTYGGDEDFREKCIPPECAAQLLLVMEETTSDMATKDWTAAITYMDAAQLDGTGIAARAVSQVETWQDNRAEATDFSSEVDPDDE